MCLLAQVVIVFWPRGPNVMILCVKFGPRAADWRPCFHTSPVSPDLLRGGSVLKNSPRSAAPYWLITVVASKPLSIHMWPFGTWRLITLWLDSIRWQLKLMTPPLLPLPPPRPHHVCRTAWCAATTALSRRWWETSAWLRRSPTTGEWSRWASHQGGAVSPLRRRPRQAAHRVLGWVGAIFFCYCYV